MIAVLLDRRPDFLTGADAALSLLTLPLGSSSVLDQCLTHVVNHVDGEILILPVFEGTPAYVDRVQTNTAFGVRVVNADSLAAQLKECEPSDSLLVLDPSCWPLDGFGLGDLLSRNRDYRGATHAVAIGTNSERTRERVECDDRGGVIRVQRLFNRVSWPETAASDLFVSLVPAQAIGEIRFQSLSELRSRLVSRGVLTRDEPVATDIVRLTQEEGFLAVHERIVMQTARPDAPLGFTLKAPEVLIAHDAHIDPSAKLTGPIMIYAGVTVEAGVTIIGPSVVGTGCRIRQGAVVAQCVLAPGTIVPPGTILRHRIAAGECPQRPNGTAPGEHPIRMSPTPIGGYGAGDDDRTLRLSSATRDRSVHLAIKRAIDLTFSAVALLALAPLLLLLAILIKLDSRGPLLFGHRREQKGGKEFSCLKFRTMVPGADRLQRALAEQNEVDGPQFKMENDPRVTRMGRVLRATNLDELPQLINVLLGQMSLVGPRPSPFRENQICVPWRRARLSVRPGITGLWQVCRGNRAQADFNQWIFYDITYVRNLSAWLDIKILAATVFTLGGKWSVPFSWIVRTPGQPHRAHTATAA